MREIRVRTRPAVRPSAAKFEECHPLGSGGDGGPIPMCAQRVPATHDNEAHEGQWRPVSASRGVGGDDDTLFSTVAAFLVRDVAASKTAEGSVASAGHFCW